MGPQFDEVLNLTYWQCLLPALHVCDEQFIAEHSTLGISRTDAEYFQDLLLREGYFHLTPPEWVLPVREMAQAVKYLGQEWMTPFVFLYDEFWLAFMQTLPLTRYLLGDGFFMLPDFWAWHVNPQQDESGWSPHRDKGYSALREDGSPKSLTIWIPLTDATPLNGCMYIVPADRDPTYGTLQDKDWKFRYADIRALPAVAGDIFYWNQAVMHWGSHSSVRASEGRVSMALEYQRGDVAEMNSPLLKPDVLPDFVTRLRLIGKQMLQYQHMYPLSAHMRSFAEAVAIGK